MRVTTPKGILLPAAVQQAIRDGATAFSVPCKPQPDESCRFPVGSRIAHSSGITTVEREDGKWVVPAAPHAPGDVVFLKQRYACRADIDGKADPKRASRYVLYEGHGDPHDERNWHDYSPGWRPARTMPSWAARTWLRITSVACVRVCETAEQEARAHGTGKFTPHALGYECGWGQLPAEARQPVELLKRMWAKNFPRHPWETTWVWRYGVEKVEGENGAK